ncbi:MAG: hypothetical protein E5V16_04960 [Mesorhizobium sp.]|nr:MAG: hypothetical protein E5V16_04960 [Mesorhizobium sp.]
MDGETVHCFKAGASTRSVLRKLNDKTGIFDITHHNKIGGQPLLPFKRSASKVVPTTKRAQNVCLLLNALRVRQAKDNCHGLDNRRWMEANADIDDRI